MHLVIIIAFAAVLWFKEGNARNPLDLSAANSALIVMSQIPVMVAATVWTTRRSLRTLAGNPADPNDAQYDHHWSSLVLHFVLLGLFVANLILTGWPDLARSLLGAGLTFGLLDLLILSPFILTLILVWIVQYPVDRAIRQLALNPRLLQGQPVHPIWTLGQYLSFNIRYQLLTIALPMILIIVGDDVLDSYGGQLRRAAHGLVWIPDALMGLLVCGVFLLAPVMLRFIWQTQPLPPGSLRASLERIARQADLTYRDILLWRSRGMVVNAAVMGIVAPLRYVLISDGLLESMTDKHIQAVFGHEAGHIRCRHIPYFIIFALLTMLIAGGLVHLLLYLSTLPGLAWLRDAMQIIVGLIVVVLWGLAFGWLSHKFEYEADLSGASSISPTGEQCAGPCRVHDSTEVHRGSGLCATAADEFARALTRVAALNGIPTNETGWRHPSIDDRIKFLNSASRGGQTFESFKHSIRNIKRLLLFITAAGLLLGAWLFRRQLFPADFWNSWNS